MSVLVVYIQTLCSHLSKEKKIEVFSSVDLRLTGWASSASSLSLLGPLEQRSTETNGALPIDQTSIIKSMRAYKIIISFSL